MTAMDRKMRPWSFCPRLVNRVGACRPGVEPLEERALPSGATPENLTAFNGALYFTTYDQAYGTELWRSDGTTAATTLVSVLAPPNGYLSDRPLAFNGSLFLAVSDPARGAELWKSDGTVAGTALVADV